MGTYTTHGIEVTFKSNRPEVLKALENATTRALYAIGERGIKYAQDLVPVDTGRLKGSIAYDVDGDEVYLGTNVEYAANVEFGTGIYAETGGRQTPWVYQDGDGNFYQTHGQKPQPFLRPAASDHANEYIEILKDSLRNA